MSSGTEELRDPSRGDVRRLTPDERVRLMLQIGERGIQFFMSAHGVDRREALRRMRASRTLGRIPSRCLEVE